MARSSDFSTSNQYVKYYIEAHQMSQSIANNTSSVRVRVWFYRTNSYQTWGTGTVYVRINGSQYTASVSPSQVISSTPIKLFEKTVTIKHNSDGSKSVPLQARINHNAPLSSDWSSTWNFKLDDIPRTSNPSVNYSSRAMGSAITISTNRKSTSFTHTLTYKFGNASGTIATNVGASYAWTIPMSLANQIPNSTSGTCTITCVTYSGGTRVGSSSVTFKATVPSSVKPSFDTITHSEYVSNVA